jgi:hypothetical protein
MGPVMAQTTITMTASTKVPGRPVCWAVTLAKRVNQEGDLAGDIAVSSIAG